MNSPCIPRKGRRPHSGAMRREPPSKLSRLSSLLASHHQSRQALALLMPDWFCRCQKNKTPFSRFRSSHLGKNEQTCRRYKSTKFRGQSVSEWSVPPCAFFEIGAFSPPRRPRPPFLRSSFSGEYDRDYAWIHIRLEKSLLKMKVI